MRLFDTHAHLEDEQLQPQIESILGSAADAGVVGITSIGTTVESSRRCVQLSERFPQVHAAVGIHPNYAQLATESDWLQIVELASHREVVAIGETGLDRYWDDCPFDVQQTWFAKHIELSFELQKPLVIHTRDCEDDMLRMLAEQQREGKIIGIMHSFALSRAAAQQCLNWGMYISFSGIVTYKKSNLLREIAAEIPDDRLLIETDSPYLSPHPHRGQRPNQPALVRHTAECLAEVRGVSLDALGEQTTANASRAFGLE